MLSSSNTHLTLCTWMMFKDRLGTVYTTTICYITILYLKRNFTLYIQRIRINRQETIFFPKWSSHHKTRDNRGICTLMTIFISVYIILCWKRRVRYYCWESVPPIFIPHSECVSSIYPIYIHTSHFKKKRKKEPSRRMYKQKTEANQYP